MPQANAQSTASQVHDLPVQTRAATLVPSTFSEADNTVEIVWTQGATVRRYDWWNDRPYDEALDVTPEAVDMTRFDAGTVQVLDGHRTYGGVSAILGIAERGWIENGEGRAVIRLSQRPELAGVVADIRAGVIRAISFGYSVERYEITRAQDRTDGVNVDLYRAARWTPQEISFVTVPADAGAGTRSHPGSQASQRGAPEGGMPCEFIQRAAAQPTTQEQQRMPQANNAGEGGNNASTTTTAQTEAPTTRQAPAVDTPQVSFDGQRAADIVALCQRHGLGDLQSDLLVRQATMDEARAAVLDALDRRSAGSASGPTTSIRTVTDEHDTRIRGIENALVNRINPGVALDDNGRQYRAMTLVEMAREVAQGLGVATSGLSRAQIVDAALRVRSGYMGTGDFPALLGGVGQRTLRAAYEQAPSTYALWARRASNLPDFRIRQAIGVGADVELKKLNEHGEYTYGSLSEDASGYRAFSFGRSLAITRQMIVNDDLDSLTRVGTKFAEAARRLENRLVYEQITGNPRMSDNKSLFHADHGNLLSGASSALSLEALSAARALMRKQKGREDESLNIVPAFLLVPTDLETLAYQLTSSNYTPAKPGDVNEFRSGGRTALEPIVEPLLDSADGAATNWFLSGRYQQIDTVEYAWVDGYEGLRTETFASEDVDGVKLRASLDFAAKAVEHRGLVKAAGK
ncbi:prohead protease/major capsid protein fusion protein [Comamonas terrae]|uniref:Prohead protease/major capsid protein fusion protein n=1 Tax=Comamonas terrae TaxID=673548 RepID=A0ABW5UPX2_9BURK|nr:prohead protease/major capsid protein fusion protein [Comamonas terrae]